MATHAAISPAEAADRLAIRELFDAYAHCADRRDGQGQESLFAEDTRFAVHMGGEGTEPSYRCRTRRTRPDLRGPQAVRGDHALQRPEHDHARR